MPPYQKRPAPNGDGVIYDFGFMTLIHEYPDGTAEYLRRLTTHFRVRICDVTGFSRTKGLKWSDDPTLNLLGQGTVIASVPKCPSRICDEIERWFRSHALFGGGGTQGGAKSVADELRKLADLRNDGILSEAEFQIEKGKLLNR